MKSMSIVSSCTRQLTVGAFVAGLAITMSLASPANAGGGNSDRAKAMAGVLSGEPGTGSAAKLVSGNDPAIGTGRSASGWGNTGSAALSPGGSITEGAKEQGKN
jgi:hypothetical protein